MILDVNGSTKFLFKHLQLLLLYQKSLDNPNDIEIKTKLASYSENSYLSNLHYNKEELRPIILNLIVQLHGRLRSHPNNGIHVQAWMNKVNLVIKLVNDYIITLLIQRLEILLYGNNIQLAKNTEQLKDLGADDINGILTNNDLASHIMDIGQVLKRKLIHNQYNDSSIIQKINILLDMLRYNKNKH